MPRRSIGTSSSRPAGEALDAISILTADHQRVGFLFKRFARSHEARDDRSAARIAEQLCNELTIHASIEDEIFYPAVRAALADPYCMDEAEIEHAVTNDLVAQIEKLSSSSHRFVAAVTVLRDYVNHHVEKEEKKIFPQAKNANLDMEALGKEMLERKQELLVELGIQDAEG